MQRSFPKLHVKSIDLKHMCRRTKLIEAINVTSTVCKYQAPLSYLIYLRLGDIPVLRQMPSGKATPLICPIQCLSTFVNTFPSLICQSKACQPICDVMKVRTGD